MQKVQQSIERKFPSKLLQKVQQRQKWKLMRPICAHSPAWNGGNGGGMVREAFPSKSDGGGGAPFDGSLRQIFDPE